MAFSDFVKLWKDSDTYPKTISDRYVELDVRQRLLDGSIYDVLQYSFEQEETTNRKHIPILKRRPSTPYNLAKIIVDQSSSLTFGEQHAPSVRLVSDDDSESQDTQNTEDLKKHKLFEKIVEESELESVMLEAMRKGSVGSVAIVLHRLPDGMPWLDVIESKYCTPYFDPADPRKLKKMVQVYPISAEGLDLAGYEGAFDPDETYWLMVTYTEQLEARALPMPQKRYEKLGQEDDDGTIISWEPDTERSKVNPFNFMNVLWIRNLEERRAIDGDSTFREIADMSIAITYAISQINRGFRYTADPLMAIEEGELANAMPMGNYMGSPNGDNDIVKSPARVLKIPRGGNIKVLEIAGDGLKASAEFVRLLREYALEVVSGLKSDQQHAGGVQSGKAINALEKALHWLVSRFRTSYGKRGYLVLLKMIIRGLVEGTLAIPGVDVHMLDVNTSLRLLWPKDSLPEGADLLATVTALNMAAGGSAQTPVQLIATPAATQATAEVFGITDTNRAVADVAQERGDKPQTRPQDVAQSTIEQQKILNQATAQDKQE